MTQEEEMIGEYKRLLTEQRRRERAARPAAGESRGSAGDALTASRHSPRMRAGGDLGAVAGGLLEQKEEGAGHHHPSSYCSEDDSLAAAAISSSLAASSSDFSLPIEGHPLQSRVACGLVPLLPPPGYIIGPPLSQLPAASFYSSAASSSRSNPTHPFVPQTHESSHVSRWDRYPTTSGAPPLIDLRTRRRANASILIPPSHIAASALFPASTHHNLHDPGMMLRVFPSSSFGSGLSRLSAATSAATSSLMLSAAAGATSSSPGGSSTRRSRSILYENQQHEERLLRQAQHNHRTMLRSYSSSSTGARTTRTPSLSTTTLRSRKRRRENETAAVTSSSRRKIMGTDEDEEAVLPASQQDVQQQVEASTLQERTPSPRPLLVPSPTSWLLGVADRRSPDAARPKRQGGKRSSSRAHLLPENDDMCVTTTARRSHSTTSSERRSPGLAASVQEPVGLRSSPLARSPSHWERKKLTRRGTFEQQRNVRPRGEILAGDPPSDRTTACRREERWHEQARPSDHLSLVNRNSNVIHCEDDRDSSIFDDAEEEPIVGHKARAVTTSTTKSQQQKPASSSPARRNTSTWDEMYERLLLYKGKNGDCLVPTHYKEDPPLGRWVTNQRHRRHVISEDRQRKLDHAGFVWSVKHQEPWDAMYERLCEYKAKKGNCMVPQKYKIDPRLGEWVQSQRRDQSYKDPTRSIVYVERKQKLDAIGFTWSPQQELWKKMYDKLVLYKTRHGTSAVPRNYKEDRKMGRWVDQQRAKNRKGNLAPERRRLLDAIGFNWKKS